MGRKYLLINLTHIFWLFALLAWYFGKPSVACYSGFLAFASFAIYTSQGWIIPMFNKHKNRETPDSASVPAAIIDENVTPNGQTLANTVIASNVHFEGNIVSSNPVYIHGTLNGTINAPDSVVKVMRDGTVEGNIICRELIIDGTVTGQCAVDSVEICTNGKMTGTLSYLHLAVKKGGQFSGKAEIISPPQENKNVVGLIIDAQPVKEKMPIKAKAPE